MLAQVCVCMCPHVEKMLWRARVAALLHRRAQRLRGGPAARSSALRRARSAAAGEYPWATLLRNGRFKELKQVCLQRTQTGSDVTG